MMKVEVTFKSGAQVVFDAAELEVVRTRAGEIIRLEAPPAPGGRELADIDLGEIAAIVRLPDVPAEAGEMVGRR